MLILNQKSISKDLIRVRNLEEAFFKPVIPLLLPPSASPLLPIIPFQLVAIFLPQFFLLA